MTEWLNGGGKMRRSVVVVVSLALASLVTAGAGAAGAEQDEALFRGLIPGNALTDAELSEVYGQGFTSSNGAHFGSSLSVGSGGGRNLRTVLMGGFKRAGLRPPLAPSGPNGTAGGGPIPTVDPPTPRLGVPRLAKPSLPRIQSGTSSGSFSGSSSTSSF
jgi:hypothetical protein